MNKFDSPFRTVIETDGLLAIGDGDKFSLYTQNSNQLLAEIECDGYFGYLYFYNNQFLICDASGICCIDKFGKQIWKNTNLGIDGVVILNIENNIISGEGEWDPPGGWISFQIDASTGNTL